MSGTHGVIYKLYNTITGKCYIGQTTRKYPASYIRYEYEIRKGHGRKRIGRSIEVHGWSAFTWEILEPMVRDQEELNVLERHYIKYYESNIEGKGYNLTTGGEGFGNHSPETIEKLSIAAIKRWENMTPEEREELNRKNSEANMGEKNHFYGKHHTEESNEKNRQSNLGKKQSEATKKKQSDAKKGKDPHRNMTEEQKAKKSKNLSKSLKGKPDPQKSMTPEAILERNRKLSEARKGVNSYAGKTSEEIDKITQKRLLSLAKNKLEKQFIIQQTNELFSILFSQF